MVDRVKNGNTVMHNGEKVMVPVALRDLVNAHGIIVDKRAMIRGEPTSRKQDTGVELILKLAKVLQQQGEKALTDTTVDGEWEEVHE